MENKLNNYKYKYNYFFMTEKRYKKFRLHVPGPNELSARMNIIPCGNDFTVEYPDKVSNEEIEFRGQVIAYQKFSNPRKSYDVFVVGGVKLDNEHIVEDGKKYLKVKPIKNKESRKNITSLLGSNSSKVGFL